jgi:hypothetical protein
MSATQKVQNIIEKYLGVKSTPKGNLVVSRDGKKKGKTTGGCYRCRMDGCPGLRIGVRWEDGKLTFPCSKGMIRNKKGWKIL